VLHSRPHDLPELRGLTAENVTSVRSLYDELAPLCHLVYEDWETSVLRQGVALASLITEYWGANARLKTSYLAIPVEQVGSVGFENVRRIDGRFFQPVLVGTRSQASP